MSSISPPNIEVPSPLDQPFLFLPFFLFGVLFLIPYQWSINQFLFYVRLVLYCIASIWLMYNGIKELIIFENNLLDIIFPLNFILLAVSAPVSLIIYKNLQNQQPKSFM